MVESQYKAINSEVFERLIGRLSVALDSAKTAVRLRNERPAELELRGLSRAELELINVYLNRIGREAAERLQGSSTEQKAPQTAKVIWLKDRVKGK